MRTGFGGHPQAKSVVGSDSFGSQKNLRHSLSIVTEVLLGEGSCNCGGWVLPGGLLEASSVEVSLSWVAMGDAEETLLSAVGSLNSKSSLTGSIVVGDPTTLDPSNKILGLLDPMSNRAGLDCRGRFRVSVDPGL